MRTENVLLQAQLQRSPSSADAHESEVLRALESCARQTELKAKELEEANAKLTRKRAAIKELKRSGVEMEARNQKLQAKLAEMGKVSRGMVRGVQNHHKALKESVLRD